MLKKRVGRIKKNPIAGLPLMLIGLLIFLLGAQPSIFGLDRSPVVGFVQIAVFLAGLALICLGGYINFSQQWANSEKSIAADIGVRLVGTGYIIAATAGMADVFGFRLWLTTVAASSHFQQFASYRRDYRGSVYRFGIYTHVPAHPFSVQLEIYGTTQNYK